jgi:electron transport complex protein RnfE
MTEANPTVLGGRPPASLAGLGLLSLTPLLGASDSLVKALGLALASMALLTLFCALRALLHPWLTPRSRMPATILLAATLASCAELGIQALSVELHQALGIYLALLAMHCLLLEYSGVLNDCGMLRASARGFLLAGAASVLLLLFGLQRELLGAGSLFGQLHWLFGPAAADWSVQLFAQTAGWGLASLAPAALLLLGLCLAAKNALRRPHARSPKPPASAALPDTRLAGASSPSQKTPLP